jgi:hypothetical protein
MKAASPTARDFSNPNHWSDQTEGRLCQTGAVGGFRSCLQRSRRRPRACPFSTGDPLSLDVVMIIQQFASRWTAISIS